MGLFKPQGILLDMSKNSDSNLLPCESASVPEAKLRDGRPAINAGFSRTAKENFFPYIETTNLLFGFILYFMISKPRLRRWSDSPKISQPKSGRASVEFLKIWNTWNSCPLSPFQCSPQHSILHFRHIQCHHCTEMLKLNGCAAHVGIYDTSINRLALCNS